MAVMIRPNLAPFGLVIACSSASRGREAGSRWNWRPAAGVRGVRVPWTGLRAVVTAGPLRRLSRTRLCRLAQLLRGGAHPAQPGELPALSVGRSHSRSSTPGCSFPPWCSRGLGQTPRPLHRVAWAATALAVLNLLLYLPFLVYDDIRFLRFMLPGITALFVLLAVLQVAIVRWSVRSDRVWLALLAIVARAGRRRHCPARLLAYGTSLAPSQTRVVLMGRYLQRSVARERRRPRATCRATRWRSTRGKPIVRWDWLTPDELVAATAELPARRYRPVLVIDDFMELERFRTQFAGLGPGRLAWPPTGDRQRPGSGLDLLRSRRSARRSARSTPAAVDVIRAR